MRVRRASPFAPAEVEAEREHRRVEEDAHAVAPFESLRRPATAPAAHTRPVSANSFTPSRANCCSGEVSGIEQFRRRRGQVVADLGCRRPSPAATECPRAAPARTAAAGRDAVTDWARTASTVCRNESRRSRGVERHARRREDPLSVSAGVTERACREGRPVRSPSGTNDGVAGNAGSRRVSSGDVGADGAQPLIEISPKRPGHNAACAPAAQPRPRRGLDAAPHRPAESPIS